MDMQRRVVVCTENEGLVAYMWSKRQELAEKPKGISENVDMTLSKAYSNICNSKNPIKTLKDLSQIKGVGKWILRLMQGFFEAGSGGSEPEDLSKEGKRRKGTKRYVPQKNSVSYALLIALYRGIANGKEFMRKQELIDAAEASGLSRVPIAPEKGKGKPGQFGSSPRDWYSGWNCMKTLITKGLVVKSSCPAKYMLTQEGQEVAHDCLMRSGLADLADSLANTEGFSDKGVNGMPDLDLVQLDTDIDVMPTSMGLSQQNKLPIKRSRQKKSIDVPFESLERFMRMGYSKDQVLSAFSEVSKSSQKKEISSLWPAVLCHLREDQVYGCGDVVGSESRLTDHSHDDGGHMPELYSNNTAPNASTLRACSSSSCDRPIQKSRMDGLEGNMNVLSMPPLSFGERFEDAYEVTLILDDREQFATQGSRSRRIIENICSQFRIKIERCGLKKLIYLVEGDPNSSEAAESIKTACFTTEILEGFDVQRTTGLADTLKKYGYLTQAISHYYESVLPEDCTKGAGVCPPYDEFVKRCQDLNKVTVSDVFAIQLMQVPQVTEDVAIAVLDLYPTLLSLARAYSLLEGDQSAQEEMLSRQSKDVINLAASKNIFYLVWGN
ncbi:crossover junction endonuclease MUS81 isoform X2 [Juglans microcarpa x Juglans regia]|uniref:crossover junction endonuclease MUS81 isoform X2 n=1 Tax=Juglans microcarpa x Juglans regia TaxID=2249226 RepID=UPI001B7EDA2F|nr:crossover junction endonuclease MUS81 isoform X2 [Juglans microcarpa x Juglans regia]